MKRINLIWMILLIVISINAQNTNEGDLGTNEITIVKDYNVFIEEATKVSSPIVYKPNFKEDENKKTLKYSIPDRIEEFKFETPTITPANYNKSMNISPNLSFAKLGLGSVLNPFIEWNHNVNKNDKNYNIYLKHHSAWLPQEIYQKYSESILQLANKNKIKSWEVSPTIGYKNKYYNFFGNLSESSNQDAAYRMFHSVFGKVQADNINDEKGKLSYYTNLGLEYSTENTVQPTVTSQNNEYAIQLKGKGVYNYSDNFHPMLELGTQIIQTNFLNKTHKNITNVLPSILYKNKAMALHAGVNFVNTHLNNVSSFYFLPTIETEVQLVANYVVFFSQWNRKIESNQLSQLIENNPYAVMNGLTIPITRVENRAGGFKGTFKDFSYNAYFVQKISKDAILYRNDSLNPRMMVADVEKNFTTNNLSLEIAYQPLHKFKMVFKGDMFVYELDNLKTSYNLPSLTANLGLQYQLNKKLKLMMDSYLLSGVKSIIKGNEVVSKINFDMNMSSEYNIYKNFYIFANINNILNTKVTKYIGYNSYGINAQGGIRIVY